MDEREKLAVLLGDLQDAQAELLERAPTLQELADEVRVLRREHLQIRVECQRLASLMESMQARLDRHCGIRHSGQEWPT